MVATLGFMDDEELFQVNNVVMIGHALCMFLPSWKYTKPIVLALALGYSVLYTALAAATLLSSPPEGASFATLSGVAALFSDKAVVFAGWVHYIAFDLMVNLHVVTDAQQAGINHWFIFWTCPIVLMLGPMGLLTYYLMKFLLLGLGCGSSSDKKKTKSDASKKK
uniref:DUF4281 domain-containing protein n=1 Tax=Chromera velia CCMP2878 TaxID=1169474 RepID=A0A0G4FYS9_9ALVE|mmetsp:Transcript_5787/g.11480  ORF Transcript_5787/g.11480 Transcript_5787/m.11480 type:complete len:165 (+) Transcript_5787:282-776(+)|eukprot:Cvel_19357.t1-p1 / transcript=Cvel_19357.t1 / gene=Cvel_19357 / organism=Chromera_velia_CCMP2878 / gene_product=hypothetical protein / transcript_product=hypothetical protein / location=Cvel_scaffold1663:2788-5420(+) / protein_length=164 / sequence_SO=supercontig / SO=protein_coding / is_pseudo=false